MRKIYFICSNITRNGGTERAIVTTVNLLKSIENITPIVVSLSSCCGDIPYFSIETEIIHCSLEPFKTNSFSKLRWYVVATKKMQTLFNDLNDKDVIFSYGHNVSIILPFVLSKARKYACEHINYFSIPRISRLFMRICYPNLDGIIALSSIAKNKLRKLNKNIYIIPNSIPFKVENQISSIKDKTIIMVGRISKEKGYERVVPIAKELKAKIPGWKIDIWGDGPDVKKIQDLFKTEQIDDFVYLRGATRDMVSVYKKSSMLIMTSYTEALPMVIIEANAFGLPCIAYECEGTTELIADGINGYLIKEGEYKQFVDKLLSILSQEELYNRFSISAANQSNLFSNDQIRRRWLGLINNNVMS